MTVSVFDSSELAAAAGALAFNRPLVQNNYRALLVEIIIHRSLGESWLHTGLDWGGWDFEHTDHTRLEVKHAAALQSWKAPSERKRPAAPIFDIAARTGYWDGATWIAAVGRHADLYVFAHHPIDDPAVADHREAQQWAFYVVDAGALPRQKSIGLNALRRLVGARGPVPWGELRAEVDTVRGAVADRVAARLRGKAAGL